MTNQQQIDYDRIAKAIEFIKDTYKQQPSLEEVAAHIHLSPSHFQRLFKDWAGTSPKKFIQYLSLAHAKQLLRQDKASLFDPALNTGLSSTSQLHDMFIHIEAMTPAEYKNGGKNLTINYSSSKSIFGTIFIATTPKGICYLAFEDQEEDSLLALITQYPDAQLVAKMDDFHQSVLSIFNKEGNNIDKIKLHIKGTDFQLKVWEALLKIPMGKLATYGSIAEQIGNSKASRAVGTAIGSNPIAYLIPCHRVIQATGALGGYMWGTTRKSAIIAWESAQTQSTI